MAVVPGPWPVDGIFTRTSPQTDNGTAKAAQDQILYRLQRLQSTAQIGAFLIASGSVAPDVPNFRVDWASGATSGLLSGISPTNFLPGMIICVGIVSGNRPVSFQHSINPASGLIQLGLGANMVLDNTFAKTYLQLGNDFCWREVDRFPGNSTAAWKALLGLAGGAYLDKASPTQAIDIADDGHLITPLGLFEGLRAWNQVFANRSLRNPVLASDYLLLGSADQRWLGAVDVQTLLANVQQYYKETGHLDLVKNSNGQYTHGFPHTPRNVTASIYCKTDNNYWSVGDEVQLRSGIGDFDVWANSTYFGWETSNNFAVYAVTGGSLPLNDWALIVRAYG